ncbi:hypothetical protein GCM10010277_78100 [Streptomyces longisporoflavus]|uniref:hypothetical protein n=1 Tax=Streptomyces longisporoflavus TaxID=28044 RepID=UPI00167E2278|nr:hypothetical protein [Streptomyces longisporoflavus]GGV68668.1 hypothetical protein GCM10010277_78100 [Streptomyces longisporoflavus]
MTNVRRNSSNNTPDSREPLPLRWGVILTAAALAAAVTFVVGGPLAALGAVSVVVSTLHTVMA